MTEGNVEIMCGVRMDVIVMVGHFTSQWDRTKRIPTAQKRWFTMTFKICKP